MTRYAPILCTLLAATQVLPVFASDADFISELTGLSVKAAAKQLPLPGRVTVTQVIEDSSGRYKKLKTGKSKSGREQYVYTLQWEAHQDDMRHDAVGMVGTVDLSQIPRLNFAERGLSVDNFEKDQAERTKGRIDRVWLQREGDEILVGRIASVPSADPDGQVIRLSYLAEAIFIKGNWASYDRGEEIELTYKDPKGLVLMANINFHLSDMRSLRYLLEKAIHDIGEVAPSARRPIIGEPRINNFRLHGIETIRATRDTLKSFDPGYSMTTSFAISSLLNEI